MSISFPQFYEKKFFEGVSRISFSYLKDHFYQKCQTKKGMSDAPPHQIKIDPKL